MTDRVLGDRYRLVDRIGSGGMGTVWTAVDEVLRRDVAVKEILLPAELSDDERRVACERARREARAAAMIDHPGVVTVHDVVVEDDRPWIVMELVRGTSLDRLVREHGPRPPAWVAGLGLRLLDALRAAHAQGVVHRDVKPGNVLISEDDEPLLTDFGIASVESDSALTRTGALVGSPGYIAPERLREEPAGPESDLWSLGATLYLAVEGRGPFDRTSPMAVLGAVLSEDPAPPRRAGSLAPLLWHLLRKDPAGRLGVDEVRRVLADVASGRPSGLRAPAPPPAVPPPPLPAPGSRRIWMPIAAATTLVVLLAAVTTVTALRMRGDEPAAPERKAAPPASAPPATSPATAPATTATATVDLCGLLNADQVRRLLDGRKSEKYKEKDVTCGWAANRRGLTLTDGARQSAEPAPDSVTEAHGVFMRRHSARAKGSEQTFWGWTEIGVDRVEAHGTPARNVGGVGDEAFVYETTGDSEPMDKAHVVFRVKTTVLLLEFVYRRGTATAEDALQAARWAAQALAERP